MIVNLFIKVYKAISDSIENHKIMIYIVLKCIKLYLTNFSEGNHKV